MKLHYSPRNLNPREQRWQRFFEILPGFTSWTILLVMIALSILQPFLAAIIMIAFILYWFMRLCYMTIFLLLSYSRLKIESKTNWLKRIQGIDKLDKYLKDFRYNETEFSWRGLISTFIHQRQLVALKKNGTLPPLSKDIYHLVIYPVAKESRAVIEPGIKSLSQQKFPSKQIFLVLAIEERAAAAIKKELVVMLEEYKQYFADAYVVFHPDGVPGEARVKGANVTHAAKEATQRLKDLNIPAENVIVSCFDSDTVVGEDFFATLTYYFMIMPERQRCSFQPIPVYHNNIWQVPGFARVIESGSSFFQLIEATNPKKLVTFSSHCMSFKALLEVDYWPIDMISDDSAIFWKAYLYYRGDYRVVPMYTTLSMDVAGADSWRKTVAMVYKQKRRWAWGVENFPIVMRHFIQTNEISLYDRMRHAFKLFEGHVAWATWGFLLSFIWWLPLCFMQQDLQSVVMYNAPRIITTLFNLALLSLLISIFLSISLLPKSHENHPWFKKIIFGLEWLMLPVILIFLNALPALDAQTRLMFGRYMEFWVTDKIRKTPTQ